MALILDRALSRRRPRRRRRPRDASHYRGAEPAPAHASSAMIGWIAASNATTSPRSPSVTAIVSEPIHQTPRWRQRQHLHVQLERVRAPADLALVLGDRARVGAVRDAAVWPRHPCGSARARTARYASASPRAARSPSRSSSEPVGGQRDERVEPVDELERDRATDAPAARPSSPSTRATARSSSACAASLTGRSPAAGCRAGAAARRGSGCRAPGADRARAAPADSRPRGSATPEPRRRPCRPLYGGPAPAGRRIARSVAASARPRPPVGWTWPTPACPPRDAPRIPMPKPASTPLQATSPSS